MNDAGIAIFVKTPGVSPVKTRLAADCGEAYAQDWYRRSATAVSAVVRAAQARFASRGYFAVAEADSAATDYWRGLDILAQGEGGLGERMARVHAHLVARHGRGLLVGADTPQLTVELLGEALQLLETGEPRIVLGPARDGGFWLFGGNVAPPEVAWTRVRYSAPDTARAFATSMAGQGAVHWLPMLDDVDNQPDLSTVLDALQRLPRPLPEQRALAAWMLERADVLA